MAMSRRILSGSCVSSSCSSARRESASLPSARGDVRAGGGARLTQQALRLPGVVVPGFDSVLDVLGDAVGGHVFDGVVHAGAVVGLARRGRAHHVTHLWRGGAGERFDGEPKRRTNQGSTFWRTCPIMMEKANTPTK